MNIHFRAKKINCSTSVIVNRVEEMPDLMICGRLGEYRYYDMDQAIGRARVLAARMLS